MKHRILAHRGFWDSKSEQNSLPGLNKGLSMGFSVETDIRDSRGQVVVSHDPVREDSPTGLDKVLSLFDGTSHKSQFLALNVKSDGLVPAIRKLIEMHGSLPSASYFFDMSIPETLKYSIAGLPFALRLSEYESLDFPQWFLGSNKPRAIWVDGFHSEWFLARGGYQILKLAEECMLTIVSPELHGRPRNEFQSWFRRQAPGNPNLSVCTDFPEEYV